MANRAFPSRALSRWVARSGSLLPDWISRPARQSYQRLSDFVWRRYYARSYRRAISSTSSDLKEVVQFVGHNPVRLEAEVVLISQVQRSGGTLLNQLLDGHSAIAAYPGELKHELDTVDYWMKLDPADGMDANFRRLFDQSLPRRARVGFVKGKHTPARMPFLLMTHLQYSLFRELWEKAPPRDSRGIYSLYFESFFNAWLNYRGHLDRNKWVCAFAPRMANHANSVAAFFEAYPRGRLVQIVRSPEGWLPSAQLHKSPVAQKSTEQVLDRWIRSAEAMIRNHENFGDRVIVMRFEDLVGDTETTMRRLCRSLEIDYEPTLLEPTFNGMTMRANSSFSVTQSGVIKGPLGRHELLSDVERQLVSERCGDLYGRVLALIRQ